MEGQSVEQVSKFRYIGPLISEDGRCIEDVSRQELERQRLHSIKEKQLTRSIRLDLRKRLVKHLCGR